jgi:hypothetical protein
MKTKHVVMEASGGRNLSIDIKKDHSGGIYLHVYGPGFDYYKCITVEDAKRLADGILAEFEVSKEAIEE